MKKPAILLAAGLAVLATLSACSDPRSALFCAVADLPSVRVLVDTAAADAGAQDQVEALRAYRKAFCAILAETGDLIAAEQAGKSAAEAAIE